MNGERLKQINRLYSCADRRQSPPLPYLDGHAFLLAFAAIPHGTMVSVALVVPEHCAGTLNVAVGAVRGPSYFGRTPRNQTYRLEGTLVRDADDRGFHRSGIALYRTGTFVAFDDVIAADASRRWMVSDLRAAGQSVPVDVCGRTEQDVRPNPITVDTAYKTPRTPRKRRRLCPTSYYLIDSDGYDTAEEQRSKSRQTTARRGYDSAACRGYLESDNRGSSAMSTLLL